MKLSSLLILVCLTTAAVRAAEPEKVLLEYKPTAGAVEYWVRVAEHSETINTTASASHIVHSLGIASSAATATPDGKLSVAVSTSPKSVMIDGKPVNSKAHPLRDTYTYVMSKRGELADPAKAAEPSALAAPVFPAVPVAIGHTWKTTVPPTKKFRLGFDVSYTLEALKDVKGRKCAVIRTSATAKGRDEKSKANVGLKIDGTAVFDVAAGAWVESRTMTHSSARFDKQPKKSLRMMTLGVLRVVTRREAGETAPPAAK